MASYQVSILFAALDTLLHSGMLCALVSLADAADLPFYVRFPLVGLAFSSVWAAPFPDSHGS